MQQRDETKSWDYIYKIKTYGLALWMAFISSLGDIRKVFFEPYLKKDNVRVGYSYEAYESSFTTKHFRLV